MLQRLNDAMLLREYDLLTLVWPERPNTAGGNLAAGRTMPCCPAFFTTVDTLTLGTGGHWHPWNSRRLLPDGRTVWVWRDMYGRPRSLRPWDGNEPTWRFEQPQTVSAASLRESVERWEQG